MKLISRDSESKLLERQFWLASTKSGRMTLVSGPRFSGKTTLVVRSLQDALLFYLGIGSRAEAMVVSECRDAIQKATGESVSKTVNTYRKLFDYFLYLGSRVTFSLVIDDFQEFRKKDPGIYEYIRDSWMRSRRSGHVNLVLICSNQAAVDTIFTQEDAPMHGLPDQEIRLGNLGIREIKSLLLDANPGCTNEDLLAIYMVTGGSCRYLSSLLEAGICTKEAVIDRFFSPDSGFMNEGETVLDRILGKNSEMYRSILQLIASGVDSQPEIEERLSGAITGGHLAKLETDYELVTKSRPVLAGSKSRNVVRYEITDLFLWLWLKYISPFQSIFYKGGFDTLKTNMLQGYPAHAKQVLVRYFMHKFAEENGIRELGGDWASKKDKSGLPDVDIVAFSPKKDKVLVCDVEYSVEGFKKEPFLEKVDSLRNGPLKGYDIDARLFSVADM